MLILLGAFGPVKVLMQHVMLTTNDNWILSTSPEKANVDSQSGFVLSCMKGDGEGRLTFIYSLIYISFGTRWNGT
jgi:hypothetical protein